MKSFFVRLSVLALATTGFSASTLFAKVPANHSEKPAVIAMGTCPTPMCWPSKCNGGIE